MIAESLISGGSSFRRRSKIGLSTSKSIRLSLTEILIRSPVLTRPNGPPDAASGAHTQVVGRFAAPLIGDQADSRDGAIRCCAPSSGQPVKRNCQFFRQDGQAIHQPSPRSERRVNSWAVSPYGSSCGDWDGVHDALQCRGHLLRGFGLHRRIGGIGDLVPSVLHTCFNRVRREPSGANRPFVPDLNAVAARM